MESYKVLNKQIFESGIYSIVPIRFDDRINIMNWRNEQIHHLRQDKPLTIEGQNTYFNTIISNLFDQEQPDQILFSFLENENLIGYGGLVHINWIDMHSEISFVMKTSLETKFFKKYWVLFLKLIEIVAFDELSLVKIFTYAYDLRPKVYEALEEIDFKVEARLVRHKRINDKFIDIIIHSKLNNK